MGASGQGVARPRLGIGPVRSIRAQRLRSMRSVLLEGAGLPAVFGACLGESLDGGRHAAGWWVLAPLMSRCGVFDSGALALICAEFRQELAPQVGRGSDQIPRSDGSKSSFTSDFGSR